MSMNRDDELLARLRAMSGSDPASQDILIQAAAARAAGESMEQVLQRALDLLVKAPPGPDSAGRERTLAELTRLMARASLVEQLMQAKDDDEEMVRVMSLYTALMASELAEDAAAGRQSAMDMQDDVEDHRSRHVRERLSRGLSASADSGEPLPHVSFRGSWRGYSRKGRNRGAPLDAPIGASRVGGLPDLPAGIDWPTHDGKKLPFLAQINLSDVADIGCPAWPSAGWLYAFGLFDDGHETNPLMLILHRDVDAVLTRAERPHDDEIWPDWCNERVYEPIPLTRAAADAQADADEVVEADDDVIEAAWLFGTPAECYDTAGEYADGAFRDGDDWINLLAIASVGSMQWSDSGDLYILIRRSDLERGNLSNALAVIASS